MQCKDAIAVGLLKDIKDGLERNSRNAGYSIERDTERAGYVEFLRESRVRLPIAPAVVSRASNFFAVRVDRTCMKVDRLLSLSLSFSLSFKN